MVRVKVTYIEWDTLIEVVEEGGDPFNENAEGLPEEIPLVELHVHVWDEEHKDDIVADALLDHLSDEYGYLVSSVVWDYV